MVEKNTQREGDGTTMKLWERVQAFILAVVVIVIFKIPSRDFSIPRIPVLGEYAELPDLTFVDGLMRGFRRHLHTQS